MVERKTVRYDSSSIETLKFPESIRKNPSMYIGGTDEHGLFVVLRELADNAVDEFLAGRNKFVGIMVDTDGSYWVQDSGAGIPQGIKTSEVLVNGKKLVSRTPTMQAVFGELHTSGKFKSEAYAVSIGSHGIGVKGTNATADFLDVKTCYKGKWYSIGFKKGHLTTVVQPCAKPKSPFGLIKQGTLIHYKPDATIFSAKSFPPSMLVEWAEIQAYLNPGLTVEVTIKGKTKTFYSKEGAKEYITKRLEKLAAVSEPDMFAFNNDLATATVAFSNADGFELKGYTNGLANSQGGKHVDSVANALFKALQPHKGTKQEFTSADFRDGMVGIVNAKLHKASFSSQDKAKLTDDRMGKGFEAMVLVEAIKFFKSNKAMAKRLCDRAAKIGELKGKFKASKAVATALNAMKRNGLPPNYAPAGRDVPIKDRELFIVEGDSAAGGFRDVREAHQALLPLSGKIMNVLKSKGDRALLSKAIINILAAVGYDPKQADAMKKLQVGKVVFLADADPDGSHINCLLNTLLMRYLPAMYDMGMVYVADMPEFYAISKEQIFTGDTMSEVQGKVKKAKARADVLHAKGWGEVDPQVLKILAVDGTRRLIQIDPLSPSDIQSFRALMGKDEPDEVPEAEDKPARRAPIKRTVAARKTVNKPVPATRRRTQGASA